MAKIRAFIAIQLPQDVKSYLAALTRALAEQIPPPAVRWVTPERMHLTVRFLGDTAVNRLPALAEALDVSMSRQTTFTLYLDHLGCFPNRKRPRVIWAGLKDREKALPGFKQEVDACLWPFGLEPEARPFQPHLTLGRIKDSRQIAGINWGMQLERRAVPVAAVHLIESRLTPDGPIYTVRHASQLKDWSEIA